MPKPLNFGSNDDDCDNDCPCCVLVEVFCASPPPTIITQHYYFSVLLLLSNFYSFLLSVPSNKDDQMMIKIISMIRRNMTIMMRIRMNKINMIKLKIACRVLLINFIQQLL